MDYESILLLYSIINIRQPQQNLLLELFRWPNLGRFNQQKETNGPQAVKVLRLLRA